MKLSISVYVALAGTARAQEAERGFYEDNFQVYYENQQTEREKAKCKTLSTPSSCTDCADLGKSNVKKCFKSECSGLGWSKKQGCGDDGDDDGGDDSCTAPTVCTDCDSFTDKKCKKQHKNACKSLGWHKKKGCEDDSGGDDDNDTDKCSTPTKCSDCEKFPDKKCKKKHKNKCSGLGWSKKKGCEGVEEEDDAVVNTCTTDNDTSSGASSLVCSGSSCVLTFADGTKFTGRLDGDGDSLQFFNVPYAKAPVGSMRWKAPEIRTDYCALELDFSNLGRTCINSFDAGDKGDYDDDKDDYDGDKRTTARKFAETTEDCLNVNIYTTKTNIDNVISGSAGVPVLYNIHGGGWSGGHNFMSAETVVANQGVMVVSIGYRLGIWGFLWQPDLEDGQSHKGNWGLLDQAAAMEWSQTFIPHFGGDPTSATISGCSAGGEAVFWHVAEQNIGSWDNFNRGVVIGMGLNTGVNAVEAEDRWDEVLVNAGCDSMECLRGLTTEDISALPAQNTVQHPFKVNLAYEFGPVVDGVTLTDDLVNLFAAGSIKQDCPVSFSYGKDEAWGFGKDYLQLTRVASLAAQEAQIIADQESTGFACPGPYFDEWLTAVYGTAGTDLGIETTVGCNGAADCEEAYSEYLKDVFWVCNTRKAFDDVLQATGSFGPFYPMEFQIPTCEGGTKTCHCNEEPYILGNVETDDAGEFATVITDMANAYGQFFRDGTFPANTLTSYSVNVNAGTGDFNVINTSITQATPYGNECTILDTLDAYTWLNCDNCS